MKEIISRNVMIASGKYEKEKQYWLSKLSGELTMSRFPFDGNRPGTFQKKTANLEFLFPGDICNRINRIGKNSEFGIFMMLITGIIYLLSKYTGNEDVIIGTPVFKQDVPGEYLNTVLALRNQVKREDTFKDLLLQVKRTVVEANENMNYPLNKICELLKLPGNTGGSPLFAVLIVFNNIQDENVIKDHNRDIVFSFDKRGACIQAGINYNSTLYRKETIRSLACHMVNYYQAVCREPTLKLSHIDILSGDERQQLLEHFNRTKVDYPKNKTIQRLFEEQVEKQPHAAATAFEDIELTYRKLNEESNQLAWMLTGKGVRKGDIVGLIVERSLEMAIAFIGILKANSAVLPIDNLSPGKRISTILKDSGAGFLLKEIKQQHSINFQGSVINIDPGNRDRHRHTNPPPLHSPLQTSHSPAMVIYTSGSTGKPKGVVLHHAGIHNHILTKIEITGLDRHCICCHNLSIAFVASIWQLYAPLLKGAKLYIYPADLVVNIYQLFLCVRRDSVTLLEVVPSLLKVYFKLLEEGEPGVDLGGIRTLLLTGEKVEPSMVNEFYKNYRIPLVNAYGQSECSDDTLHYNIPYNTKTTIVPVGSPANNTRIYILCKNNQCQPVGVHGELYIGGDGLAAGYINRPGLTAERFVLNPFLPGLPGERMFRTGDLARWLRDGNVEFLGRVDQQVKIRGNRIELREIESRLLSHNAITGAVVAAAGEESDEKYLCAYVVSTKSIEVLELREYLSGELPDYMIPSYFVQLEKLPLNTSGKVDRKRLPEPGFRGSGDLYILPRDETEKKLVEIWSVILAKDKIRKELIGIDADFFELGGHSVTAIICTAKIHKTFNVIIPVAEIFNNPTIRGLSKYIKGAAKKRFASIRNTEDKEYYPLSSAQKRLYTLHLADPGNLTYNMPRGYIIEEKVEKEKLEEIFKKLTKRHESLRTTFLLKEKQPAQQVHDEVEFLVEYYETGEENAKGIIRDFVRPFVLNKAPLLRVGLMKIENNRHILVIDIHHIITDYFSNDILIQDFTALYQGDELKALPLRYRDFSQWHNNFMISAGIKKQEKYWLDIFKDKIPYLTIPTDYARPALESNEGEDIVFFVENEMFETLKELAKRKAATLYVILLAVYYILLFKYSGQEDILVGTTTSGRNYAGLENIMGIFVNMLALRNRPGKDKTFSEFIKNVKETTLTAFENQDFQFDELVRKLGIQGYTKKNPLFECVFNFIDDRRKDKKRKEFVDQLKISPYGFEHNEAPFNLLLNASVTDNLVNLMLTYSTLLFKRTTIEKMIENYLGIITQVLEDNDIKLSNISVSHDLLIAKSSVQRKEEIDFDI